MLLTITSSSPPADDLGYLLHKNPANLRTVDLAFGRAHVFWPESSPERASVSLLVEVDPVGLVRRGRGTAGFALAEHVNDRPYVASSLMSVAIARLFGTAMSGRSEDRPDRVDASLSLTASLPVVACREGEPLLRRLFEPLGYQVQATSIPLDPSVPDWGDSRYLGVELSADMRLRDLLSHLYVLLPVLDDDKHYWVAQDEIEKLLARGGDWLAAHPDKELITRRYLRYRDRLTREALTRLLDEDQADPDADEAAHDAEEEAVEERVSLRDQRLGSVLSVLRAAGAHRVLDLGCGPGTLLKALMKEPGVTEVVGVDVSARALDVAARRLHVDTMAPNQRDRLRLLQGSLTYRDRRLNGFDAAVLMEVVEHLEPERLEALERSVFAEAAPTTVIVTTPNIEYNVRFESLLSGHLRHRDHRFEWTRAEFRSWADGVAERNRYRVRYLPVGEDDPEVGPPTQLAVFAR
jgi:3' terminal RNA ribose 2'-O-methyltransferase Hen1